MMKRCMPSPNKTSDFNTFESPFLVVFTGLFSCCSTQNIILSTSWNLPGVIVIPPLTLSLQRLYKEAHGLYSRALMMKESTLGEKHLSIAVTLNDFATLLTFEV